MVNRCLNKYYKQQNNQLIGNNLHNSPVLSFGLFGSQLVNEVMPTVYLGNQISMKRLVIPFQPSYICTALCDTKHILSFTLRLGKCGNKL